MIYLTTEQVLFIHDRVIEETALIPEEDQRVTYENDHSTYLSKMSSLRHRLVESAIQLRKKAESFKEKSAELTPSDPDYEDHGRVSQDYFDIDGLFSDL